MSDILLLFVKTFSDVQVCCKIVSVLYGLSIAITFGEKLQQVNDYDVNGWFTWKIFRFDRDNFAVFRRHPRLMDGIFGRVGMSIMLGLGLVGVVVMWFAPVQTLLFTLGVAVTVFISFIFQLRSVYGGDGALQMNLIIGVAILLGFNPWVERSVASVSLVFIAANSGFAYFTSGFSKLISPVWMRGDPLIGIFSTKAYGSELALQLFTSLRGLRRALAFSMVLFEVSFPAAIFLPKEGLLAFLVLGVAFHLSNAVFMGLNTFLWSFLATYPTICYVWLLVHQLAIL